MKNDTVLIPPPCCSYFQIDLPIKLQKARRLGLEVRLVRVDCKCKDCKRCIAKQNRRSSKVKSRIQSLSKQTKNWTASKIVTLTGCSKLSVSSELVRSLEKKNLLESSDFVASVEAGEHGELHIHILLNTDRPDDEIIKGIQTWMKRSRHNIQGHFDVTSFDSVHDGVSYVCKDRTPEEHRKLLPKRRFTCSRNLTQRKVPSRRPSKKYSELSAPPPKETKQSQIPCGQQAAIRITKPGTDLPVCPDSPLPLSFDEAAYAFRHFQNEAIRLNKYGLDFARESFLLDDNAVALIIATIQARNYTYFSPEQVLPPPVLRLLQRFGLALPSFESPSENKILDDLQQPISHSLPSDMTVVL